MPSRLNVIFRGKRTTARFPGYLFDLAILATGFSESALCDALRFEISDPENDLYTQLSASDIAISFMRAEIKMQLKHPFPSKHLCHVSETPKNRIVKI
jgi:hypothetical protein